MGKGGARPNSGPKHRYTDADGNPLETRSRRVPKVLTDREIEIAVWIRTVKDKGKLRELLSSVPELKDLLANSD